MLCRGMNSVTVTTQDTTMFGSFVNEEGVGCSSTHGHNSKPQALCFYQCLELTGSAEPAKHWCCSIIVVYIVLKPNATVHTHITWRCSWRPLYNDVSHIKEKYRHSP